jgi:hypothetical protein
MLCIVCNCCCYTSFPFLGVYNHYNESELVQFLLFRNILDGGEPRNWLVGPGTMVSFVPPPPARHSTPLVPTSLEAYFLHCKEADSFLGARQRY